MQSSAAKPTGLDQEQSFFDEKPPVDPAGVITEMDPFFKKASTSKFGAHLLRAIIAVVVFALFLFAAWKLGSDVLAVVGLVVSLLVFLSCHVMMEWERAVVMRAGRVHRIAGPGIVMTLPLVDFLAATMDMRIRSNAFRAEHVLTSDLVPVNVDAVLFWHVDDARKASLEVRNFEHLVFLVAQTTLRDVMGSIAIAQLSTRRTQINKEVQAILEQKTGEWGISVVSVEIRDIAVPDELQDALSIEAQAKQEFSARLTLAEAEREVADIFVDAARAYKEEDSAMQLRAMSYVYDAAKEKGGLVVIPSALSQAYEGLANITPGR